MQFTPFDPTPHLPEGNANKPAFPKSAGNKGQYDFTTRTTRKLRVSLR
jgi:hypothetical protein